MSKSDISDGGLRVFSISRGFLGRNSQVALRQAMKKVSTETVVWHKTKPGWWLESDFGGGVKATLYPGSSENDTSVSVTDGSREIEKKFPEMWRVNWKIEQ